MTVGQLVAEQPARSRVFERWGLDYCCGGKRPLSEACSAKNLKLQDVLRDLAECEPAAPLPGQDWTRESLTALCDHIEQTHHAYVREALPRLSMLTEKVARAHGAKHPELVELRSVITSMRTELDNHLLKEEYVLFPLCRALESGSPATGTPCGSVQNPIRRMEAEHTEVGEDLELARALTNDFAPPKDACNTYRAMLQALAEFEADMHRHIHKENSILFPRAVALEAAQHPVG
ncbi:MAG: iron-sulfur cluster repair di-iron protein [Armatimonadetes bacterium]|nr:iron-sulfur cluster repair di-iron protein [Armatimonadota bacterium]MDE2206300.1 iron-sulfur cluster repair di-iron protein [Armatimonadota bacterium]